MVRYIVSDYVIWDKVQCNILLIFTIEKNMGDVTAVNLKERKGSEGSSQPPWLWWGVRMQSRRHVERDRG